MCQEGIRIGRRSVAASVSVTAPNATWIVALKRREDRLAVIVMWAEAPDPTFVAGITAASSPNTNAAVLGTVNPYSPTLMLDVERFGVLVTGEVWVSGPQGAAACIVTEVYLDVPLPEAAAS